MEQVNTIEETDGIELNETCVGCLTIPVSHLALETPVPIRGWQALFDEMGIKALTDSVGREAISVLAARKLLRSRQRRDELFVEDSQRRTEELAKKRPRPGRGLPAIEGASPVESLLVGAISPAQEFGGGRERPNFLREELEAGQRDQDEKRRDAAAKAKQRLIDQMRDSLQ